MAQGFDDAVNDLRIALMGNCWYCDCHHCSEVEDAGRRVLAELGQVETKIDELKQLLTAPQPTKDP